MCSSQSLGYVLDIQAGGEAGNLYQRPEATKRGNTYYVIGYQKGTISHKFDHFQATSTTTQES